MRDRNKISECKIVCSKEVYKFSSLPFLIRCIFFTLIKKYTIWNQKFYFCPFKIMEKLFFRETLFLARHFMTLSLLHFTTLAQTLTLISNNTSNLIVSKHNGLWNYLLKRSKLVFFSVFIIIHTSSKRHFEYKKSYFTWKN